MITAGKTYGQLLRDPRWQRRRLEIMSRARFRCENCDCENSTLNVHHRIYHSAAAPWEYTDGELICLCEDCHLQEHLLADAKSTEPDAALEEAIEAACIVGTQTKNLDTQASAFRVMGALIRRRSPGQIERMELAKGLR